MPLHRKHVEIRPAVLVVIDRRGVSGPAHVYQADLLRDIDESVAAGVAIESAALVALVWLEMPFECVRHTDAVAAFPALVARVDADVAQEQVE